jgi:hypothetical protein
VAYRAFFYHQCTSQWSASGLSGSWVLWHSGSPGSWAHRLMGSWAHGHSGSWALWAHGLSAIGLLSFWALGVLGTRAHGHSGSWALGLMGSWAFGLSGTQALDRALGHLGSWARAFFYNQCTSLWSAKVEVTREYFLTPYREFENQLTPVRRVWTLFKLSVWSQKSCRNLRKTTL